MKSFAADTAELMNRMGAQAMQMQGTQVKAAWPVDLSHMEPTAAANWLVGRYWNDALPVQPGQIAQSMGVSLQELTGQESSPIYHGPSGELRLAINRQEPLLRQRVAVARGLGHIVLRHRDPSLAAWRNFGDDPPSPHDKDASLFAATLLVPSMHLRFCMASGWARNARQIVEWFDVPESLVALRYQLLLAGH